MKYILGVIIFIIVIMEWYVYIKKDNLLSTSVNQSTGSIIEPYMNENEDKFIKEGLAGDNDALFEVVQWGVKTSEEKKDEYLLLLVDRNYPPAIRLLAMSYERGSRESLGKDSKKASALYIRLKNSFPEYCRELEQSGYDSCEDHD